MKKKYLVWSVLLITMAFMMTGCIPGDGTYTHSNPAGFFWGIWHGWLAPLSLIISFFDRKIRIYEVMNTGFWYDLGFYIAVISGFGGLSLSRKKRSKKHHDEWD